VRGLNFRKTAIAAALATFAVAALLPRVAVAADKRTEATAKDALKKAQAEYAAHDYDKAAARLDKAQAACGAKKCTTATKAALLRDLGALQLKGGDADAAMTSFASALKLEPQLEPSATIDAPGMRDAWNAAKDEASVGEQPWGGDFVHVPVSEQVVRTPVPVYVELSAGSPPSRVFVKYRGAGTSEYKRIELTKKGKGWGGLIPCGAATRGVLRYYVQGFDEKGEPVANGGEANKPFYVRIRPKISSSAPSLPDSPPPRQCSSDSGDGASGDASGSGEGSGSGSGDDGSEARGEHDSAKATTKEAFSRVWIGVLGSVDLVALPAANDVCHLDRFGQPGTSNGYYCASSTGADFPNRASTGENNTLTPGNAGQVPGGIATGNVRVMATFDYALSASFLAGLRAGWVFRTYPGDAASKDGRAAKLGLHLELRATFLFGNEPLANVGFAPYVFAAGGYAESDASAQVTVTQTGIPGTKSLDAWLTRGPWFASVGGGVRYALSRHAAFLGGIKLTGAFGTGGILPIAAPELALQYGF
jgi:tetratricopeptide (TPR) repeat protein